MITEVALHAVPRARDVVREQTSAVGHGLWRQALIVGVLLGIAAFGISVEALGEGKPIPFRPQHQMLPALAGFLLPMAVWWGERPFRSPFLWTFPVDRRRHAVARVFGGWVWLMAGMGILVLWQLLLSLVSGGSILRPEALIVVGGNVEAWETVAPSAARMVEWAPAPLLWLVPFTAATATYLLSSAAVVGIRYPLRWMVGIIVAFMLMAGLSEAVMDVRWLVLLPSRVVQTVLYGPYGLDQLFTASTESLKTQVKFNGDTPVVWRGLPDVGLWASATVLWTAIGLAALWAAASRHRETRRW